MIIFVVKWYILYSRDKPDEKRLLFRYKESLLNRVYDSGCYSFISNRWDNGYDVTFEFDGSKYCEGVGNDFVDRYLV